MYLIIFSVALEKTVLDYCAKQFNAIKRLSSSFRGGMVRVLNVAEKNDAAKNIAELLSNGRYNRRNGLSVYNKIYEFDYNVFNQRCNMVMTSVSGHLLELEFTGAYRKWQACNPVSLFDAPIIRSCPENYQPIKKTLEREIKNCQHLVIWTDCDREGEHIGFEIIEVCKKVKPNVKVHRAKFSEITKQAVTRAINNLIAPDERQNNAVNVRQELDLRIGAAFTRFQTLRLQRVFPDVLSEQLVSYGSCQFPTLGFVVDRYKQVQAFIPEDFWKIKVTHKKKDVNTEFLWRRGRLFDHTACLVLYQMCLEQPLARVIDVRSRPKSKWRPQPLDTVELEKLASRKLNINAKQALNTAEKLYTKGFISYPRTETTIFPKELDLSNLVQMQTGDPNWGDFANRVLQDGPNPRQGTKTDNAHPPIHPTKYTDSLQGDEKKIYEFVVRRFLACLSKDAQGQETTVEIEVNAEKFAVNGLMIIARNYLEVYPYEKWNAKEIAEYAVGETFDPDSIEMTEGHTSAPDLLSEADLIALMEKHGIGTDATHSEHIETVKSRLYVGLNENNRFVPGELGMGLVEGYDLMGFHMSKPNLRAELESDLKKICDGIKDPAVVLREQVAKYKQYFIEAVRQANKIDTALSAYFRLAPGQLQEDVYALPSDPVMKCPKCSGDITVRTKRDGRGFFLSCMSFPTCTASVWFPESVEQISVCDEVCNECPGQIKKLKFKVKRGSLQPFFDDEFVGCVGGCDVNFTEVMNIRPLTAARSQNAPGNSSVARESGNSDSGFESNGTPDSNFHLRHSSCPSLPSRKENQTLPRGNGFVSSFSTSETSNFPKVRPPSNVSNGVSGEIMCSCGQPALLLTVRKDNDNKGRRFYKCASATEKQCGFFLWEDESHQQEASKRNESASSTSSGALHRPTPRNSASSEITCSCGNPARLLTVSKDGENKGRQFYRCRVFGEKACSFFQWADEINGDVFPSDASAVTSNTAAPKTTQKRGSSTSKGGPSKRKCGLCCESGHNRQNCPMKQ